MSDKCNSLGPAAIVLTVTLLGLVTVNASFQNLCSITMAGASPQGPSSLCGDTLSSRRGLLASLWTLLTLLQFIAFVTALIFTLSAKDDSEYEYDDEERQRQQENENEPEMAVTSRAMAFAALWTAVLATLLAIFGTVILGWQSPTGRYYTCCSARVHRTTPLALGSFIGALLMFANLTLVCSVLFGEFEIRDYQQQPNEGEGDRKDTAVRRSSMAFSIMCVVLTVLYAGFAALTFVFSKPVLAEMSSDYPDPDHHHQEVLSGTSGHHLSSTRSKGGRPSHGFVTAYQQHDGYIGERFDVMRPSPGFVAPAVVSGAEGTLT